MPAQFTWDREDLTDVSPVCGPVKGFQHSTLEVDAAIGKMKQGKSAGSKGLRVNAGKTKVMQCWVSRFQSEDSGKYPCGVCRKGVASNSIRCVEWVHKRCSGISGKLKSNNDFHCRRCLEGANGLFQSVLLKEVVVELNVSHFVI